MATYRYTNPGSISFQLTERPIYGSSRVGSYVKTRQLYNEPTVGYYGGAGSIIQRRATSTANPRSGLRYNEAMEF